MRTSYDATVARPIDAVWSLLTDVDSVIAALPGAVLAKDNGSVSGSFRCKLGSTQVTYRITAAATVGAAEFRTSVLTVTGTEARGTGTLDANLTVALRDEGASTRIEISGDIDATGRGQAATERAWKRVIELNLNALLPPAAPPSAPPPAPPAAKPRPPLAVAPQPVASPARKALPDSQRQLAYGFVAVALLLLFRRLRKRRK